MGLDSVTIWLPCVEKPFTDAERCNAARNMIVSTYYANLPPTVSNQLNHLIYNMSITTDNVFFPHTGLFFTDIAVASALGRW